jgi:predicted O-methyltransferase YrrM
MTPKIERQENFDHFVEKYSRPRSQAARQVELTVLGHEFGLNGYTNVERAEILTGYLLLSSNNRLLDLGAGRGWPGLHLAVKTGCSLLSTDLPLEALQETKANIKIRGLEKKTGVLAADGRALPFVSDYFDAIVHADVFC